MFLIAYMIYVGLGTYLCHKSNVAFNYYLHKRFPRVTPVVEPTLSRDILDFLWCLILGIFAAAISWSLRMNEIGQNGVTLKGMWNVEVGKDYN